MAGSQNQVRDAQRSLKTLELLNDFLKTANDFAGREQKKYQAQIQEAIKHGKGLEVFEEVVQDKILRACNEKDSKKISQVLDEYGIQYVSQTANLDGERKTYYVLDKEDQDRFQEAMKSIGVRMQDMDLVPENTPEMVQTLIHVSRDVYERLDPELLPKHNVEKEDEEIVSISFESNERNYTRLASAIEVAGIDNLFMGGQNYVIRDEDIIDSNGQVVDTDDFQHNEPEQDLAREEGTTVREQDAQSREASREVAREEIFIVKVPREVERQKELFQRMNPVAIENVRKLRDAISIARGLGLDARGLESDLSHASSFTSTTVQKTGSRTHTPSLDSTLTEMHDRSDGGSYISDEQRRETEEQLAMHGMDERQKEEVITRIEETGLYRDPNWQEVMLGMGEVVEHNAEISMDRTEEAELVKPQELNAPEQGKDDIQRVDEEQETDHSH